MPSMESELNKDQLVGCEVSDGVLQHFLMELVDDAMLGLAFEIHRSIKLGLFILEDDNVEDDERFQIVDEVGLDVFGQTPMKKQIECVCPSCQRCLAASRFAPHLEKCMGMGRNSSRIASRRIANNSSASFVTGGSDDDDDDDWTLGSDKRNKKRREKNSPRRNKLIKVRNGEKQTTANGNLEESISNFDNLSTSEKRSMLHQICGVVSEHTGKRCTRSARCPQHSEEQRQLVRISVLGDEPYVALDREEIESHNLEICSSPGPVIIKKDKLHLKKKTKVTKTNLETFSGSSISY